MAFNRPPRIQPDLPIGQVEIPGPSNVPSKPSSLNILGIGLPLGAVLLTVVLMSAGGTGGASFIRFLPIMLATYLATGITYVVGRRNYKRQLAECKAEYDRTLSELDQQLSALVNRTRQVLQQVHPGPDECLERVQHKDARIGERRPHDSDFLSVRIGLGTIPVPFELKLAENARSESDLKEEHARAVRMRELHSTVDEAPIFCNLAEVGSLGVAGSTDDAEAWARGLICSLVTAHWPDEVNVGFLTGSAQLKSWSWLFELPHYAAGFGGGEPSVAASESALLDDLETELRQREEILAAQRPSGRHSADQPRLLPRLIFLFVGLDPDFNHPALSLLLSEGRRLGAHGIFLTQRPERVPGECGAVVQVARDRFRYQETGEQGRKTEGVPDRMQLEHASRLASGLAAIDWPEASDASRPPDLITMLDLFEVKDVDQMPIERWWDGGSPYGYLRAPVGRSSATSDLIFDLNDQEGAHGPHGLIGGMTGSGKSEILKTILLALAATHSPYDLNFALIDYKGGAAFNELAQLPHTVGVVTDIATHATYAERVILALSGEIERRKRILERARSAFGFGRSHIDEYRKLSVKRPLPRLVIVFDEFAEFKGRHPEESKRLIGIARQGRSLGVHLILATQNIEAAVDPEILQNSTFRICLRVSQPQDSMQMIGTPDAVNLPRGRAYFRAQTRQQFQGAYTGGFYQGQQQLQRPNGVVRVDAEGRREQVQLPGLGGDWKADRWETDGSSDRDTEAQAIVNRMLSAAKALRIKRPSAVWPDPLPRRLYLPELLAKHYAGGWDGSEWSECRPLRSNGRGSDALPAVIGLYDDPAHQKQTLLRLDPDRGGNNLLIFGSAGTGKTTLLRTILSSIARTHAPDAAQAYVLDFGGSSALKLMESFPHVGAVVTRFEEERTIRLVRFIQDEISRRSDLLRMQGVDNYRDFNTRQPSAQRLPSLYLIVDGFGEFKRLAPPELVKSIGAAIAGGAAVGLHVIVSANIQSDVPNDLLANVSSRLTFHLADQTEYFRIVGRPSEAKLRQDIENPPPPGRGLMRGTPPLEFQTALPVRGQTEDIQASNLAQLSLAMEEAWKGARPQSIHTLPFLVSRAEVSAVGGPPLSDLHANLGLDFDSLSPLGHDLEQDGPTFLVAGVGPRSGKTTALRTWILELAAHCGPERLQLTCLDFHTRTLRGLRQLPHIHSYVGSATALDEALKAVREEVARRQSELDQAYDSGAEDFDPVAMLQTWPHQLIVIDDYERFAEKANGAVPQLAELLSEGGELGVSFIVAGNASELPKDFDDRFMRGIRRSGCGLLLTGTEGIEQFNNARRPAGQPASGLPPGRGYLIKQGTVQLFQVAAYWSQDQPPDQALSSAVEEIQKAEPVPGASA